MKETLALRNLASNLVNDGYLIEAKKICDDVIKTENYDPKIHDLYTQIDSVESKEKEEEDSAIKKAEKRQKFYCRYAESYLTAATVDLNGKWENDQMQLEISSNHKGFVATGQYKKNTGGLLSGLLNLSNENKIIEMAGYVHGLSGQYKKNTRLSTEPKTLLGEINNIIEGLIIVNRNAETIEICEITDNKFDNYYILRRVTV